jgi:hypothetical protein
MLALTTDRKPGTELLSHRTDGPSHGAADDRSRPDWSTTDSHGWLNQGARRTNVSVLSVLSCSVNDLCAPGSFGNGQVQSPVRALPAHRPRLRSDSGPFVTRRLSTSVQGCRTGLPTPDCLQSLAPHSLRRRSSYRALGSQSHLAC